LLSLVLSLGFAVGVLAVVLAAEYERRNRRTIIVCADPFRSASPVARFAAAASLIARAQDSTLPTGRK
jgi:hypothetical protein